MLTEAGQVESKQYNYNMCDNILKKKKKKNALGWTKFDLFCPGFRLSSKSATA